MHYGMIKKCDIANGEGIRVSLFVSGCRNRCKNCFQPETWAFDYGKLFDAEAEKIILDALNNPSVRGLTVLGGEPMEPENQAELLPLVKKVREKYPEKSIWFYTGYTLEHLSAPTGENHTACEYTRELLSMIDILVDGRYEEELKNIGLRFRGSENQRIIDMKKTKSAGSIVIWDGCMLDKRFSKKQTENDYERKN